MRGLKNSTSASQVRSTIAGQGSTTSAEITYYRAVSKIPTGHLPQDRRDAAARGTVLRTWRDHDGYVVDELFTYNGHWEHTGIRHTLNGRPINYEFYEISEAEACKIVKPIYCNFRCKSSCSMSCLPVPGIYACPNYVADEVFRLFVFGVKRS